MTHLLALPAGTELVGEYRIDRVLGAGGFGITYLAEELALGREVTIKEYFPGDFAARNGSNEAVPRSRESEGDYQWGLDRFIAEAQTLAMFDHRNIVRVYRYFRANNTGYMVLHFEEGQSLKGWLQSLGRAPRQFELDQIVAPLLDALEVIHNANFLHRDIAPDNIIIRRDGAPVLIDFGSARGDIARHSRTVSALVKPGYSPYEQYAETGSQQGPWTDIYALAATLYHAITGKRPPDAPSRIVKDELVPAREAALSSYRPGFLRAIDQALSLDIKKRPQSIPEWRGPLLAPEPRKAGWVQRTIGKVAAEEDPPAKTLKLDTAAPPPPDAPGAKGGLIEYIERLRRQSSPAATASAPTAAVEQPKSAEQPSKPAPKVDLPSPAEKPRARNRPAKPARARQPWKWPQLPRLPRFSLPRLPRIRPFGGWRWRPLILKLMIGLGVAAFAVGLQDRLPGFFMSADATRTGTASDIDQPRQIAGHSGGTSAVAFTDDGRRIVTAGEDRTLKIWDVATGSNERTIGLGESRVTALAVRGSRAVTGREDGTLQLWDLAHGERLAQFQRNSASIWSVTFMGDAEHFAASGHDWTVAVWDARFQAPAVTIEAHKSAVQDVAFSPNGGLLASGGADRLVKLWDASSGELIRTFRGHRDFVSAIAFSPDGKLLASAGHDGQIRLSRTSSGRLYRVLSRRAEVVHGLAFSPAGSLLAAASADGRVRIWSIRRGRLLRSLGDGSAAYRSVAFSPDGRWLAAGSDSGSVTLWNVSRLRDRR
jgi:WD40 repeat protein/serine/threonine protein kinase